MPEIVPLEEDVARIGAWFTRLAEHVRAVDFGGARPIFADDLIAFGGVPTQSFGAQSFGAQSFGARPSGATA
jgi:hypothetical protein